MMNRKHCELCWLKDRRVVDADVHIDDRDLCIAHVRAEGLNPDDGVRIIQPPTREPIAPVLQREKKAKAAPKKSQDGGPVLEHEKPRSPSTVPTARRTAAPPRAPKSKPVMEPRKCAWAACAKEFTPTHPKQRHCSHQCYQRDYYRANRPADVTPRVPRPPKPVFEPVECAAEGCANVFTPKRSDQKCCSDKCYARYWHHQRVLERQRAMPERVCQGRDCHNTFKPKRSDQRFCCPGCKNSARIYTTAPIDLAPPTLRVIAAGLDVGAEEVMEIAKRMDDAYATPEAQARANTAFATIRVTEHMLDGFWAKLSIAEKAAIVERELAAIPSL